MATLRYTALITPEELQRDALASLGLDLSKGPTGEPVDQEAYDAAIVAIEDVTGRIKEHLNRGVLIVEKVGQRVYKRDWAFDMAVEDWTAWADEWPVLQVDTAGVEMVDRFELSADVRDSLVVEYHAGYRRADQDLADLQAAGLDLTVSPRQLPGDIRRVATTLALNALYKAENKQLGTGQTRQQIGGSVVTVESVDTGFEQRELDRINKHRRLAI